MAFHLSPTLHTPEMRLSTADNRLVLRGVCFPENSLELFRPLRTYLEENLSALLLKPLEVYVELSYINSSSQRELYRLLYDFLQKGGQVKLIIYEGEEDDELEDLRHVVHGLEHLSGITVEYRPGHYGEPASSPSA
ncbi:MAG: DUF1987 domain-containing protein [Bacteroidetes bacterium]|nr:MAG: DUF1987 domain-containing protein [Bacteroidota bacterium]